MHVENWDIWLISVGQAIIPVIEKQFKRTMLHVTHATRLDT